MHEMSLCEGILQIIQEHANQQKFTKVKTVWLEVGELASVEIESLRFCFDVISKNSLADNATLNIINLPGKAWCLQCAQTVTISNRFSPCPECGSYQLQITGGEELKVKELEVR